MKEVMNLVKTSRELGEKIHKDATAAALATGANPPPETKFHGHISGLSMSPLEMCNVTPKTLALLHYMVKKGYRLYFDTTGEICSPVNNEGDPESLQNGGKKVYQVSLVGRHPNRKAPIILSSLTCTTTNWVVFVRLGLQGPIWKTKSKEWCF
jgi:hypothetical protein